MAAWEAEQPEDKRGQAVGKQSPGMKVDNMLLKQVTTFRYQESGQEDPTWFHALVDTRRTCISCTDSNIVPKIPLR